MCLYPKLIKNRKYTPNKKNGGVVPAILDKRVLAVPTGCQRCMECRKQKAREWHVRLLEEVKEKKNGIFVTLTFSNESIKELKEAVEYKTQRIEVGARKIKWKDGHRWVKKYKVQHVKQELKGYELDNAIATIAVERFRERWRKEYKKSIRHWLVTELGHNGTENIHLHGIVWTDKQAQAITKHWKYGYTWLGNENGDGTIENYVNGKTVSYITKYVHKMDEDHKEYKSIILTSAGIGAGYLESVNCMNNKYNEQGETKEYYKTSSGHEMALPIYYRNKIYRDEEREKLWLEKLDKQERWVGGEQVSIKDGEEEYYGLLEWYRAKNARLGYGTGTIDWNRKKYEEERRMVMIRMRIEPDAREWLSEPDIARGLELLAQERWNN